MATQVKQTCFVSAPYGVNIEPLIQVFGDSGIDVARLDNLVPGAEIPEFVRTAVDDADFFCAVLPEDTNSGNVLFELGIAAGLEKRLFLIVEPGVDLPLDLRRLPYVRASLSNAESLAARIPPALRTFVNGHRSDHRTRENGNRLHLDFSRARLAEILELAPHDRGEQFERFVRDLFAQAGYEVSTISSTKAGRIDLAVWIDEIESVLGNPILVELRSIEEDSIAEEDTLKHLRDFLAAGAARCCLLVHLETSAVPSSRETAPGWPLIFYFSADELATLAANGSLPKELIARRNRAVHAKV